MRSKSNAWESSQNHCPPGSVEKLSSMKPVSGAKMFGNLCSTHGLACNSAMLPPRIHLRQRLTQKSVGKHVCVALLMKK